MSDAGDTGMTDDSVDIPTQVITDAGSAYEEGSARGGIIEIPIGSVSRPMSRAAVAIASAQPTPVLTARSEMSIEVTLEPKKPFWAPLVGLPDRTETPLCLALQLIGVERWEDSPWMRVVEAWELKRHSLELFDLIDKDNSGTLEKREMINSLHKDQVVTAKIYQSPHDGIKMLCNPKLSTKSFQKMDSNKSGYVDRDEFVQFTYSICEIDPATLARMAEFGDVAELPAESWEGHATGVMRNGVAFGAYFVNGRMHGKGTLVWPDGLKYTGELRNNIQEGLGKLEFPDGSTYEGQGAGGLRDGEGKFVGADGSTYEGGWKAGKRHGQGELTYADGGVFNGQWKAGFKCGECDAAPDVVLIGSTSGQGKYMYSSGSVYEGGWLEDQMHGHGQMLWHQKHERYTGEWCEGQPHGSGEHTWLETAQRDGMVNNRYSGEFDMGARHGKGSFFYCDNTVYEGEWSQNEKHGSGVWREHNGDEMETNFVHNRILDKESGEYVASIAHMQGKVSDTGDLPLAEAEDQLNVGSMFSETGKNAPDSVTIQKVQDLINRHRVPLTEIYRYYAALGESVGEAMYTLSCHQFCQLCKDCQLPNKMFPLAFCDALFTEQCQQVKTAVLPLKQFFSLLVKVSVKRYPELSDSVYKQIHALLEERILPHAKTDGADTFRSVLYQPTTQALILKMRPKLAVIFDHYAAQDLDSEPDAFLKTNTLNMREYLMMLSEMHFLNSLDDLRSNEKKKDKIRALGVVKAQQGEAEYDKLVKQRQPKTYKAEFGAKEAFASFAASNADSDWENVGTFTLDTEMVMMEFVEGLARLALIRLERGKKPIEQFELEFQKFLTDMVERFPHWTKYIGAVDKNLNH